MACGGEGEREYQQLGREIRTIREARTNAGPAIVGALGEVRTKLTGSLLELDIRTSAKGISTWNSGNFKEVPEKSVRQPKDQMKITDSTGLLKITLRVRNELQRTETAELTFAYAPHHVRTTFDTQEDYQNETILQLKRRSPLFPQLKSHKNRSTQSSILYVTGFMLLEQIVGLPPLKSRHRAKLRAGVGKVNGVTKRLQTHKITELN